MHDVLASLGEGVQPNEERIRGDFPLVLREFLVLEVAHFKLSADIECLDQLVVSDFWLLARDEAEYCRTINRTSASVDDGIADLSDQYHESCRCIVVL